MGLDLMAFVMGRAGVPVRGDVRSYLMGKAVGGGGTWETISDVDVATFTAKAAPLKKLVVDIAAVQTGEGTPSPENVRPIIGWDKCKVYVQDSYDPTGDPTAVVDLGSTVYGGTLDAKKGTLTVTHRGLTLDGTEEWTYTSALWLQLGNYEADKTNRNAVICNQYPSGTGGVRIGTSGVSIAFYNTGYSDPETWKAYIADLATPIEIVYPLATPLEVTLAGQTVSTLEGQNVIFANTGNINTLTYLSAGGEEP